MLIFIGRESSSTEIPVQTNERWDKSKYECDGMLQCTVKTVKHKECRHLKRILWNNVNWKEESATGHNNYAQVSKKKNENE